jgi:hypothetical protein
LEGTDEGETPRGVRIGNELLEEGRGSNRIASTEFLRHGESNAPRATVVLTAVATVGEVTSDGFAIRLRGSGGVARVRLDVGEDRPGLPLLCRVTELRFALDRLTDFLPRFVQAAELSQTNGGLMKKDTSQPFSEL